MESLAFKGMKGYLMDQTDPLTAVEMATDNELFSNCIDYVTEMVRKGYFPEEKRSSWRELYSLVVEVLKEHQAMPRNNNGNKGCIWLRRRIEPEVLVAIHDSFFSAVRGRSQRANYFDLSTERVLWILTRRHRDVVSNKQLDRLMPKPTASQEIILPATFEDYLHLYKD